MTDYREEFIEDAARIAKEKNKVFIITSTHVNGVVSSVRDNSYGSFAAACGIARDACEKASSRGKFQHFTVVTGEPEERMDYYTHNLLADYDLLRS